MRSGLESVVCIDADEYRDLVKKATQLDSVINLLESTDNDSMEFKIIRSIIRTSMKCESSCNRSKE